MTMDMQNTMFLEIERKYTANRVNWDDFVELCRTFNPNKELLVSGPDTYYEKGSSILRWRRSLDTSELTVKARTSQKSSFVRKETDLKIVGNHPKTVINFITSLGYNKIFRIYKTCHIFWIKNDMGEASIVIYKVKAKDRQDRIFIEIEAQKGQLMSISKEIVKFWEEQLGLKPHQRINKTLLEIYSDRQTQCDVI